MTANRKEILERIAVFAARVMAGFEEHGAGIWPHYADTDENDGERLREALEELKKCQEPK
jgi:hypothetical protein